MGWGGISLNDECLDCLPLKRDTDGFKIVTKGAGESSISAGQGAEAAIEISTRLVEL